MSFRESASRARRWLQFKFPTIEAFRDSDLRAYLQDRDKVDNKETKVSKFEKLHQRAIWGVEIFGPSEIDFLYTSFSKLGWDKEPAEADDRKITESISELRLRGIAGIAGLGKIVRKGTAQDFVETRQSPMPESVELMTGYVVQVSPSVTAVVLCFVLKEECSSGYRKALDAEYSTAYEAAAGKNHRMVSVEDLKARAVKKVRVNAVGEVKEWFRQHLSGYFSSPETRNHLPTAELITTTVESVLRDTNRRGAENSRWADLASCFNLNTVWTSSQVGGLAVSLDQDIGSDGYHALVGLRTDFVRNEEIEYFGDRNSRSYAAYVSSYVNGILVQYALAAFLIEVSRVTRRIGDTLRNSGGGRRSTCKAVDHMHEFFKDSTGIPAMTAELTMQVNDTYSSFWSDCRLQGVPYQKSGETVELVEFLGNRIEQLASTAQTQEQETRRHFEQLSTIFGISESIRAQQRMELVAVLTAMIAAASLVVALAPYTIKQLAC